MENLHLVSGKGLTVQFFRPDIVLPLLTSVVKSVNYLPTRVIFMSRLLKENILLMSTKYISR